jgi:hypothetical protein
MLIIMQERNKMYFGVPNKSEMESFTKQVYSLRLE